MWFVKHLHTSTLHKCLLDSKALPAQAGKVKELESFFRDFDLLDSKGRKDVVLTVLAMLKQKCTQDTAGAGSEHIRYNYMLPVVGPVSSLSSCFDISAPTIARYHRLYEGNHFLFPQHGNTSNKNAMRVDADAVARWSSTSHSALAPWRQFAFKNKQQTKKGVCYRMTTTERHTMLTCYFTWEKIHSELLQHCDKWPPLEPSFRHIVQAPCPEIHLQSPRDHVCDICTIYGNILKHQSTADPSTMALIGRQSSSTQTMHTEYLADIGNADDRLTIDFAQNVTLPHVAETPSQWYLMSLISVSVFGIYSANAQMQFNHVYSERKGDK
ncbi:TPA: hypothetical protein N0F65_001095 [Lagenidium giganteum]|uniref:Uncharacterized protein n=1 Tax=Lagenidium giganteum TaxID=4803 RepID=A0AAV2YIR4_9STRA|nr:TPA: hypothetical protein N0F65_001095 [Lagenidium giganteum]